MSKAKHLIEKIKMKAGMFAVSLTIMLLNVQNVFADVKPDEQGLKDLAAPYIRVGINIGLQQKKNSNTIILLQKLKEHSLS